MYIKLFWNNFQIEFGPEENGYQHNKLVFKMKMDTNIINLYLR